MVSKLQVWNGALREIGETRITDTGDAIESARVLTGAWDSTVAYCLEAGLWNFALNDTGISTDTGPQFGHSYQFNKPGDWVRTASVSASPTFYPPLEDYADQDTFWRANVNPLYVRYVSNDTGRGMDLAHWPTSFTRYVELELAWRIGKRVNQSDAQREVLAKDRRDAKLNAQSKDAMNEAAPKRPPPGRLVRSRMGIGATTKEFWRY